MPAVLTHYRPGLRQNDPDFAPIRARLARVYMEHKADWGSS